MPWIKIDTNLASKPEVFQIARACRTSRPTVVGHLVAFWSWLDVISRDGQHLPVTTADIDALVGLDGFAAALRAVNWLSGRDGDYSIPLFERHNGNTAKARALESEAKRLRRESDNPAAALSDTCPTEQAQNVGPEKRREEGVANATPPRARAGDNGEKSRTFPPQLDTPPIRAAWDRWVDYTAERNGGRCQPMATYDAHLGELLKIGPERAVEAIDNAIAAGLRKPCLPLAPRTGTPQPQPQRPVKMKPTVN